MGWRAPANCTSSGKILLALAPAATREEVLNTGLARLTTRSHTDARRLRADSRRSASAATRTAATRCSWGSRRSRRPSWARTDVWSPRSAWRARPRGCAVYRWSARWIRSGPARPRSPQPCGSAAQTFPHRGNHTSPGASAMAEGSPRVRRTSCTRRRGTSCTRARPTCSSWAPARRGCGRAVPVHVRDPQRARRALPVAGAHAARAHHQPAHVELMRDMGIEDQVVRQAAPQHRMGRPRSAPAWPARRSAGSAPGGRIRAGWPTTPRRVRQLLRPAADAARADPGRVRRPAAAPAAVQHRVPLARQDDDGVTATVRDRLEWHAVPDPGQVPDRRRRRPQQGRRRTSACRCGRDGHRGLDEHRLRGRLSRTSPIGRASCTGCCSPARRSAGSAPAWSGWSGRGTSG